MSPHELWNRYMACYDLLTGMDSYSRNLDDIASHVSREPETSVLDAGSGTGNLSILLKKQGVKVTSLDFSETALQIHRGKDPGATLVQASLGETLPFESNSFDFVCCTSVLFTLPREACRLALSEFNRVLRPGGRVVITVAAPNKRNSTLFLKHVKTAIRQCRGLSSAFRVVRDLSRFARIAHYNRALQKLPDWQGYHRFTEVELRDEIGQARFAAIDIGRTYGDSFFLAVAEKS